MHRHVQSPGRKETLSTSCIYVKGSFSVRKVTLGQAFFGSCCFFITRLNPLHESHTAALFPPCLPTSIYASRHPVAAPGQGKTGLRNSLLNCCILTADPLLHVKQDLSLSASYPTVNCWIILATDVVSQCRRWERRGISGGTPVRVSEVGHFPEMSTDASHPKVTEVTSCDVFRQQKRPNSNCSMDDGAPADLPAVRVLDWRHTFEQPQK